MSRIWKRIWFTIQVLTVVAVVVGLTVFNIRESNAKVDTARQVCAAANEQNARSVQFIRDLVNDPSVPAKTRDAVIATALRRFAPIVCK